MLRLSFADAQLTPLLFRKHKPTLLRWQSAMLVKLRTNPRSKSLQLAQHIQKWSDSKQSKRCHPRVLAWIPLGEWLCEVRKPRSG
ncbi:unnamed protein product [Protopolystoma xenopodis]|uniref:Uncharacterized protein n=1 Tax=Protopolystoma xenopodis TaxID=117903 RepID=A0A448WQY1_9PLAT|nr:unnamed protein product [Protopolystoma xenopodis]